MLTSLKKILIFVSPWKWKNVSRCSLSLAKPTHISEFCSCFRVWHRPAFKLMHSSSHHSPTQYTYLNHALPIINLWNSYWSCFISLIVIPVWVKVNNAWVQPWWSIKHISKAEKPLVLHGLVYIVQLPAEITEIIQHRQTVFTIIWHSHILLYFRTELHGPRITRRSQFSDIQTALFAWLL